MKMKGSRINFLLLILLVFAASIVKIHGDSITCYNKKSPCFLRWVPCPAECPSSSTKYAGKKVCVLNCNKPTCKAECRSET